MSFNELIYFISDNYLIYPVFFMFALSVLISIRLGFVQFSALPMMMKVLFLNKGDEEYSAEQSVSPRTALLVNMSTVIGVATIAGPIMAIGYGGPAALSGFVLASVFGAAANFLEIFLAIKYREIGSDGTVLGGPMQYLKKEFGVWFANFYALALFVLLMLWSSNQANSISILLESAGISRIISGLFVAVASLLVLIGGIRRLGVMNDAMVPFMCLLYLACNGVVIWYNLDKLSLALKSIFMFWGNQQQAFGALSGFSLSASMRWGIARAVQSNEVGIGTATFAHSSTNLVNPYHQASLGIVPVYASAFLTTLTGITVLVSGFAQQPGAVFDISMFFKIMAYYFPGYGVGLLLVCGAMFSFGTILGNFYSASRCFSYLFSGKGSQIFYLMCASCILFGSLTNARFIWTIVDFFVIPVAIPHMLAIFIIALRTNIFSKTTGR